jgi:hypothetical protein
MMFCAPWTFALFAFLISDQYVPLP